MAESTNKELRRTNNAASRNSKPTSSSGLTRRSSEKMDSPVKPENDGDIMKVRAYLKELRLTPRKVSLVASLVRGRTVDDALLILSHTPKRAAKDLAKVISSARANAINNHNLKADGLKISTLSVTAGSRLKRYRPVSRGMAHSFMKRTSNIFVELTGEIKPAKVAKSDDKVAKKEEK